MIKTPWQIWLGAVLVLALLVGGFAVWVWEPWNPLNPWNCRRVAEGMTVAQIEPILGRPVEFEPCYKEKLFPDGQRVVTGRGVWRSGDNLIIIWFDGRERVISATFRAADPPTFRQRVRGWLGLEPTAEEE